MGDRGNIVVRDFGGKFVYLYGHWSRSQMPEITNRALSRRLRWDDAPYLARILFCELIGNDIKGETGFGISGTLGDGDETVVVDVESPTTVSFAEFINLQLDE